MDQALPTGTNQINDGTTAFENIVADSKSKIQEHAEIQKQKRGPGRPRKNPAPASSETSVVPPSPLPAVPAPPPDIAEFLKPPILAISTIPAVKYRIPELAFTDEEAKACASSLNQILTAFVPDVEKMDPKTAAVITAGVTFGSIGIQKYQIFQEKRAEQIEKARQVPPAEPPKVPVENLPGPGNIPANSYFQRTQINP